MSLFERRMLFVVVVVCIVWLVVFMMKCFCDVLRFVFCFL